MQETLGLGPAFTLALSMVVGIIALVVARWLRFPGIVMLLAAGVILGPDLANVIVPDQLGGGLSALVGFAVAVILFEGGLNLSISRLRREAVVIRRLVTLGAVITMIGGMLAARLFMGWSWPVSVLFGSLVIVTGPTVVTPLLRRIRVKKSLATILEAEGVLIDAIGAVIAVATLEVVLSGEYLEGAGHGIIGVIAPLLFGVALGAVGGGLMYLIMGRWHLIPEGLENVFTLSAVVALYHASDYVIHESGIAAVTAAGLVVGNLKVRSAKELQEFKEQLTQLLIAVLFVLLAADVRLADVVGLGWPGVMTVAALMVIVRPAMVWASTRSAKLSWQENVFMSWMAPRGIVAAAVASLFADRLATRGFEGGTELRALVFLVIAMTVTIMGVTGGPLASLLGIRRGSKQGYAILGAGELPRALGAALTRGGHEIVLIDSSPQHVGEAERDGFRVVFGNGLQERTLARADVDSRIAVIAATPNEEVNLLFVKAVRELSRTVDLMMSVRRKSATVVPENVREAHAKVLFGVPTDLELWESRFRQGMVTVETWSVIREGRQSAEEWPVAHACIPMVRLRGKNVAPVAHDSKFRDGDRIEVAIFEHRRSEVDEAMREAGFMPAQRAEVDPEDEPDDGGRDLSGPSPEPMPS